MMTGDFRKWLAVGTGVGIRICGDHLEVTVARLRGREAKVLAAAKIDDFRNRPASEWGAEYTSLLAGAGAGHLAATVILPRSEVIVRPLELPGVGNRDLDSAVRLQVDSLHPYSEEGALSAWAPVKGTSSVLVGIARRDVVEHYVSLFAEAGVRVSSLTLGAAVIHSAARLRESAPPEGFLILMASEDGLEAYGESPARPIFSTILDLPPEEAVRTAAAELRVDADAAPRTLMEVLPEPQQSGLNVEPVSYAAALAAASPWLATQTNLLPSEQRATSSRVMYVPTLALVCLLLIAVGVLAVYGAVVERNYLQDLESEIAALTPEAARVRDLDESMGALTSKREEIFQFQRRTGADLDALEELTGLLEPPAWLRSLQLRRDNVQLNGQAPVAAPLLELIDDSPLFRDSQFTRTISQVEEGEEFAIRATREEPAP